MRLQLRHACALIVGLATLAAMAGVGTAQAAPIPGPGSGSAVTRPQATTNTPQLTTNTKAGCNVKPEKGHAQCFAVVRTPADGEITPLAAQPPPTALGPADIQDAYKLPTDRGAGQTVAIVDAFGYSSAEEDLAVFRDYYGLPPCTTENGCFTKVDQRGEQGNYPPDNSGWATETAPDLDAVSSACPACHILLVEADDNSIDNLGAAVDEAVAMGAVYVSNSYGTSSDFPDRDHFYNHAGVAITAASGDSGNVTIWPSTNPNVIAVGGTRLTRNESVPRGWDEVPWIGGGSGCSRAEPKPDYQRANGIETNCENRATADIAADADPTSGLGIYDTLGRNGWLQVGGTSLASPLLAAMYALAGPPVPGTYAVSYPYNPANAVALFDITKGANGSCGNVLCTAGPGWDGPTGMGTPNGVGALTTGQPYGQVAGQVTDAGTGAAIAGATVSTPEGYHATSDANGHYDLYAAVGSHDVTASAYGYAPHTLTGVSVSEGETTTIDFALETVPSSTLSGTVTEGSGHGWPLYAKVTVADTPLKPVFTDPYTGHYSISVPQQATYTVHVSSASLPGYQSKDVTVAIGTGDAEQDIALPADLTSCTAPGLAWTYAGIHTGFTGWSGSTPQDGWAVTDDNGSGYTWEFGSGDEGNQFQPTKAEGDIAYMDPALYGGPAVDASLVSPVVDLSGQTAPVLGFDSNQWTNARHIVSLSVDGGQTWTTVDDSSRGYHEVPIPQAAGKAAVRVRFRAESVDWLLDNVYIGSRSCDPVPGGLVAGVVTDANTGAPVNGAAVAGMDEATESVDTAATPDDANVPDGFYEAFLAGDGDHDVTATARTVHGAYAPATATVHVATGSVTRQDLVLEAGHLTVTKDSVAVSEVKGDTSTVKVTLGNDGTAPVHVRLGERATGFTPMGDRPAARPAGAPLQEVRIPTRIGPLTPLTSGDLPAFTGHGEFGDTAQPAEATPSGPAWLDLPDLPEPMVSNVVAYHGGEVYSVTGLARKGGVGTGYDTPHGYVYDPATQLWTRIADAPRGLQGAVGGFVDGRLYVAGGWYRRDGDQIISAATYVYDPPTDAWSPVADVPHPVTEAGTAVLGGKLYVIGGVTPPLVSGSGQSTNAVYRFDPGTDAWTRLADYPVPVAAQACAGIAGEIVCAGGGGGSGGLASTYVYDLGSDTWTQGADMPYGVSEMASSAANGKLVVAGGLRGAWATNRASAYDPVTDTWSALPNANEPLFLPGGACGFYYVGGYDWRTGGGPQSQADVLPAWDQCGDADDVAWLAENTSEFDLAPEESVTVKVRMDSSVVDQPGDYLGELFAITHDSPYANQPVETTMHVDPPVSWGKVAGTVTDAGTGDPIASATVQLCSNFRGGRGGCGPMTKTLTTDAAGRYQWWLDIRYSPLQVVAASDHYLQQVRRVRIRRGKTATVDFGLHKFG